MTLHFSGGGAVRLEVECIEAALQDLGAAWATPHKPSHAGEDGNHLLAALGRRGFPGPSTPPITCPSAPAALPLPEPFMPLRLSTSDPDFEAKFSALLTMKREASADVDQAVRGILADVRARGDAALIELSQKFDSIDLGKTGLRVTAAEVDRAVSQCSKETLDALAFAARPHR